MKEYCKEGRPELLCRADLYNFTDSQNRYEK
jgi:hypothetical protein